MQPILINKEIDFTRQIAGDFVRHPNQVNSLLEADAEIIRLPGHEEYIVLKTDGIHEEIKEKLYEDPYLIGWMAVTAPLSDIAAVGAVPTGILLSLTLLNQLNVEWLQQFKAGINDACDSYNIHVLGGDTNFDDRISVNATVVAHIKSSRPLLRSGIRARDYLYATAPLGTGNAYAYYRYFDKELKINYQPMARLAESRMISEFATACMDTSDGLFPALSVLSEINETGFSIDVPLQQVLSADALAAHRQAKLPEWTLLAGPHGEYELLFSIPEKSSADFKTFCKNKNWYPVYIGKATEEIQLSFLSGATQVQCHPATIANLFYESGGNVTAYFELLMQQHKHWDKK